MKTILALAFIIAQLIGASPELAAEWPLFPEGVTWASTPEEICETQGTNISRLMCYETFQMLTLESVDIPALEGEYPDVSFIFTRGEMIAAAWQLDESDDLEELWIGLRASEMASRTLSTQALGKLTFKSVADAASFSENYAQSYARGGWRYLAYGFDYWREIVVTLDYEGKTAYMPLGLVNVNGRWLAAPFSPIISGYVNMPTTLIVTEDIL